MKTAQTFMEQFKNVWTSLVSPHEIFASNSYFVLIVRHHFVRLYFLSRRDTDRRPQQSPGQ